MTPASNWTDWFWQLGGAATALAGLALLAWALLADWLRHRGRARRCGKCWYDMSGVPGSMQCPECGRTAKRERTLHKSRRRWRWAVASLLVFFIAYDASVVPRAQRDGWFGLVPTTAIIISFPSRENRFIGFIPIRDSEALNKIYMNQIESRALAGEIWHWQQRWLAEKAVNEMIRIGDLTSSSYGAAWRIAGALHIDSGAATEPLTEALESSDSTIRLNGATAASILALEPFGLASERTSCAVISMLGDRDPKFREAAVNLIEFVIVDSDDHVHSVAALLDSDDWNIRVDAIRALTAVRTRADISLATNQLERIASEGNSTERRWAQSLLRMMNSSAAPSASF